MSKQPRGPRCYTARAVVVASVDDWSLEQLTERLRASGALPRGRVTRILAASPRTTIVSTVQPFRLEYSPDAPTTAPSRLLLKVARAGRDGGLQPAGEREVTFYRQVAPLMPGGPFPRCYDAEFSSGCGHVLLDDLSDTHVVITDWPLPPSIEACERIVDTWAAFHAFWWGHPRLGKDVGVFRDEAALAHIVADVRRRYACFAEALGDRLWPAARTIYNRVYEVAERLNTPERLYSTYTVVHGDAHVWNLLYPRGGAAGIVFIDWDAWRVGRAALDLAYMMAVHWFPERRARLEAPLLERYHAGLRAHGVIGYGIDRLWEDYRMSVIAHLSIPVWQHALKIPPSVWWPHLHRIVAAFDDLGCAALLP